MSGHAHLILSVVRLTPPTGNTVLRAVRPLGHPAHTHTRARAQCNACKRLDRVKMRASSASQALKPADEEVASFLPGEAAAPTSTQKDIDSGKNGNERKRQLSVSLNLRLLPKIKINERQH